MPIDASIYQNIRPVEAPSFLDAMSKASNLRSIGMQQQLQQQQLQAGQMTAHLQKAQAFGEGLRGLATLNPADRAAQWPKFRQEMIQSGITSAEQVPEQYDEQGYFQPTLMRANQTAPAIDARLKQSHTLLMDAEAKKNLAEAGQKTTGKPLAAEQADKMAGHESAMGLIGDLRQAMDANKESMGPIMGRIASANPYDTRGQALQALVKKAAQAIGKSLEGGKLTDQDYVKYTRMLPNQSDNPDVATAKLDQLERLVNTQKNAEIGAYQKSGYDTSRFQPAELKELGITQPAPSKGRGMMASAQAAAPAVKQGTEEGGYVYMGGDPGDQKNWKKAR